MSHTFLYRFYTGLALLLPMVLPRLHKHPSFHFTPTSLPQKVLEMTAGIEKVRVPTALFPAVVMNRCRHPLPCPSSSLHASGFYCAHITSQCPCHSCTLPLCHFCLRLSVTHPQLSSLLPNSAVSLRYPSPHHPHLRLAVPVPSRHVHAHRTRRSRRPSASWPTRLWRSACRTLWPRRPAVLAGRWYVGGVPGHTWSHDAVRWCCMPRRRRRSRLSACAMLSRGEVKVTADSSPHTVCRAARLLQRPDHSDKNPSAVRVPARGAPLWPVWCPHVCLVIRSRVGMAVSWMPLRTPPCGSRR